MDGVNGVVLGYSGQIEISGKKPYIDFHFQNEANDYTTRIIEASEGILSVVGKTYLGEDYNEDFTTDHRLYIDGSSCLNGNVTTNGVLNIKSDTNPRIDFFREESESYTSRVIEATPGVLSVSNKLRVGGQGDSSHHLRVDGTSYHTGRSYHQEAISIGSGKTNSYDGMPGVLVGSLGYINICSETSPYIGFSKDKNEELSFVLKEAYPGVLSMIGKVHIGEEQKTDTDYNFQVDGTGCFKGDLTAYSYNGVKLTTQGDANQFLSADGTYKNIDITGMQNKINELESIIKELKEKLS